jgi:hypothetical protein
LGNGLAPQEGWPPVVSGHDPDLEDAGLLILQIIFGVADAGAGGHHLHVAGLGPALVAETILVRDRTFANVGDDLHVRVRVRRKAGARRDHVVIPHAQRAPIDARRIVIIGKGKMVLGIEPAVIGAAKALERTNFDHRLVSPGAARPSATLVMSLDVRRAAAAQK